MTFGKDGVFGDERGVRVLASRNAPSGKSDGVAAGGTAGVLAADLPPEPAAPEPELAGGRQIVAVSPPMACAKLE